MTADAFLDAGDAARAGETWLVEIARTVGLPRGRIERFNGQLGTPGADNHTVLLWDGTEPRAMYMVVRTQMNRSRLIRWERPEREADDLQRTVDWLRESGCCSQATHRTQR